MSSDRRIKVLIDATSLTNDMTGVTRYGIELFKYFKDQPDYDFSFLISPSLKRDHQLFELFNQDKTKFYSVNVKGIGPSRELKLALFKFTKLDDYDVFHCLTTNAPFTFSGKSVTTIHDLKYIRYPEYFGKLPKLKSQFLRAQIKWALKSYSKIVCISQSTLSDLQAVFPEHLELIRQKCVVLTNGLTPIKQIPGHQVKIDLPEKYFFYVGELRPHKNIQNLIEAFTKFQRESQSDIKLVIAGKKHPSFDLDLSHPQIQYLGPVADGDLYDLYKNAICLTFPSLYEGFGLPILEAMELQVPVLTSNLSSMPEVGGDAALLVDPHSINDIAEGMRRISRDENLRAEMIRKGEKQVANFSWSTTAQGLLEIYRNLAR